jgi:hypothetical protein
MKKAKKMNRPVAGLPVNGRSAGPDRSNGRPAGLKCGTVPDRTGTERPVAGTGSISAYWIEVTIKSYEISDNATEV